MSVDHTLLQRVLGLTRHGIAKQAYVPPTAAPPMDPSMMMGGGAPMPPGGAGMPMDPSMMMGGGAGMPMDPSMMGGMPPGMPMDPSMMMGGGMPPAPPPDPSQVGSLGAAQDPMAAEAPGMEGMMPVMLTMADLQAILAQAAGSTPAGGTSAPAEEEEQITGRVTNKRLLEELTDRISSLEDMLAQLLNAVGVNIPEAAAPPMSQMGPETGMAPGFPPEMATGAETGMPEPMSPEGGIIPDVEGMGSGMKLASAASPDRGDLRAALRKLSTYR